TVTKLPGEIHGWNQNSDNCDRKCYPQRPAAPAGLNKERITGNISCFEPLNRVRKRPLSPSEGKRENPSQRCCESGFMGRRRRCYVLEGGGSVRKRAGREDFLESSIVQQHQAEGKSEQVEEAVVAGEQDGDLEEREPHASHLARASRRKDQKREQEFDSK